MVVVRFDAGHDRNGNPRRCFALLTDDGITAAWDEGYKGSHAIPEPHRAHYNSVNTFPTTPAFYRALLRGNA